jgi:hypothetical protein
VVNGPRPAREEALRAFRERFLNRTDFVAILAPWGKPCPVEANGTLDELLLGHLLGDEAPETRVKYESRRGSGAMKGRFRVGSYCPGPDDTTRWLCLDFDGAGHADALADPKAAALAAHDAFTAAGLPAYLERSGGGKGWHLWCFFDPPLPAAKAQALGRALAPMDAPLAGGSGEVADPRAARGIEVFPKQPKHRRGGGYGNLVWLPWWRNAPEGGNCFYRRAPDGALEAYAPSEFATASPELVDRLLAAHAPPPRRAEHAEHAPNDAAGASSNGASDAVWAEWRRRALAALSLEAVYGAWLTGKPAGPGWLECRDPASPTGDQHPSASVADGTGEAERGAFHSFIRGTTLSVFDFLVEHGGAADFRAARERIAQLTGVAMPPGTTGPAPPSKPRPGDRPEIRTNNRQLRDIVADAWRAARAAGKRPQLFVRSGGLVRLVHGEDGPRIEAMDEASVYGYLARIADWVKVTEDATINVSPVKDVARDMLAYPHPELPVLEAVVSTPVFDRQGALVSLPGYHAGARLWYFKQPGFETPQVPSRPSPEDLDAARGLLLDDLLVDFPFAAQSDRAHALAALVLPFVRRMVAGCTPIHLIEAPTPGSGKGLLGDLISIVTVGRTCEPTTLTQDEDEARKKITSLLAKAQPVILLDNIRTGLDSSQLASALTAETWSDRILGQTRMIDLPNRATWIVTANNPHLSLEIARRCVRVRLDAKTDRPWARTGFKHSPLREWAKANRARLVRAVLVLVRAWLAAGKPPGKKTLGSFESWAAVVGGILEHAGVPGFLHDTEEIYETADAEGQEWRDLVHAWWEKFGPRWVSAGELLDLALERDLLGSIVRDQSQRAQKIRLGKALSSARDRHFSHYRIVAGRNANAKTAQYRLIDVGAGDDANAPPGEQLPLEGVGADA